MPLIELLHDFIRVLDESRKDPRVRHADQPLTVGRWRHVSTTGMLHLYALETTADSTEQLLPFDDISVSVLLAPDTEPIEGYVVDRQGTTLLVQTFESLSVATDPLTVVADASGFLETAMTRLSTIATAPERFTTGPAERLVPWIDPSLNPAERDSRTPSTTAAFTTIWTGDSVARRAQLATNASELARLNKRVLLITPDHHAADAMTAILARSLRAVNLPFKSLVSRYENPLTPQTAGIALTELGFEAQMHQFYAKSRADKAALRKKYERFRELTPILAYKAERQRDLDQVKHLEWRLLTAISEHQAKIKEIDATLAEYESLPIWKRLAFQSVGKNLQSLPEYRSIHDGQVRELMTELETAQRRIDELKPQAAIPKEMRPEYDELKEEITRLGGTQKIRELLAAEEGTNRQAFMQNKRIVVTTAGRVITDPLFTRVRFDALLIDHAPSIPSPYLLAAAALVRERIVLSGDSSDIRGRDEWASPLPHRAESAPASHP